MTITIDVTDDNAAALAKLRDHDGELALEQVVERLVLAAVTGAERGGSWERGWIEQAGFVVARRPWPVAPKGTP